MREPCIHFQSHSTRPFVGLAQESNNFVLVSRSQTLRAATCSNFSLRTTVRYSGCFQRSFDRFVSFFFTNCVRATTTNILYIFHNICGLYTSGKENKILGRNSIEKQLKNRSPVYTHRHKHLSEQSKNISTNSRQFSHRFVNNFLCSLYLIV